MIEELTAFAASYDSMTGNDLARLRDFLAPPRPSNSRIVRLTTYDENEPWQTVDYQRVKRGRLADFAEVRQRTASKTDFQINNRGLTVILDRDELKDKTGVAADPHEMAHRSAQSRHRARSHFHLHHRRQRAWQRTSNIQVLTTVTFMFTNASLPIVGAGVYEYRAAQNFFTNTLNGLWLTNVSGGFNFNSNGLTIYSLSGANIIGTYNGAANGAPGTVTTEYGARFEADGILWSNLPASELVGMTDESHHRQRRHRHTFQQRSFRHQPHQPGFLRLIWLNQLYRLLHRRWQPVDEHQRKQPATGAAPDESMARAERHQPERYQEQRRPIQRLARHQQRVFQRSELFAIQRLAIRGCDRDELDRHGL